MLLTGLLKGAENGRREAVFLVCRRWQWAYWIISKFEQNDCKARGMIGTSVKKTRKRSQPSPPSTTEIRVKR